MLKPPQYATRMQTMQTAMLGSFLMRYFGPFLITQLTFSQPLSAPFRFLICYKKVISSILFNFYTLILSIMKSFNYVAVLVSIYLSVSMINAQMLRSHSSDEDNAPLLPQSRDRSKGKSVSIPITSGSAEYHEGKLSHHQNKVAYHESMSNHLAYGKHNALSKAHQVEAFRSKDLMAAHNDYSEGLKEGRFLPGPKMQKKKKSSALPNPPKSREEAEKLIDQPQLKHISKTYSKHLPLDRPGESYKRLNRRLNKQKAGSSNREKNDKTSSASVAHLAITNFR